MDPEQDLDHGHINEAAQYAADALAVDGVARVRLAPGDMTEYRLLVVTPGAEWAYGVQRDGREYWVALCNSFGTGHPWSGGPVAAGYAAEKWTNRGQSSVETRQWTGEVVARFLTAVSEHMQGER